MRTRTVRVSQQGESGGIFTRGNLKFKSSEMARNGSKNVKSEVDF